MKGTTPKAMIEAVRYIASQSCCIGSPPSTARFATSSGSISIIVKMRKRPNTTATLGAYAEFLSSSDWK